MRSVQLRKIGYADVLGGGQVNVRGNLCFVGHINPPEGTTILDVSDPSNPLTLGRVHVPMNTHSHKVRSRDNIMLVNNEAFPEFNVTPEFGGGLRIFDISSAKQPQEICFYPTGGRGVHRFDFDGTYAYLSTEVEGFCGNIILILDLSDPARPVEIGKWWMPGQWTAGGEVPTWEGVKHRVHHGLRNGNRLYVGCCHAGIAIVDITDLSSPQTISRHPLHGLFSHTLLPVPGNSNGKHYAIAVDEGWWDLAGAFTVLDVTNLTNPTIAATVDLPTKPTMGIWQPHQPHEEIIDDLIFVAWFSHGLQVIDLSRPANPAIVGSYLPEMRSEFGPLSNDVFADENNKRVYLLDRVRGLEIIEYTSG
jgi:hypothetical protein